MTTTPTFNDLTPPDELLEDWKATSGSWPYKEAARWGARHGYEQARKTQQWPVAIDGLVEPPEEKDGDVDGRVQYQAGNGLWGDMSWLEAASTGAPWLHTPRWQPRQPTLKEQAREQLKRHDMYGEPLDTNLILSALEQAGRG
jgi:hypothetical protein